MRFSSLLMLVACLVGCSSGPRLVAVPQSSVPLEAPTPAPAVEAPPDDLARLMAADPGDTPARATGKITGAMLLYTYRFGQIYPIQTAVHQGTTVLWPVGEQIRHAEGAESVMVQGEGEEKVAAWSVEPRVSGVGAQERQGLVITPRVPKLKTTLSVFTSRHVYILELTSTEKRYQPLIGFYAPEAAAPKVAREPMITTAGRLGVGYEILAPEGAVPNWTPLQVWDDTRLTVFRFAPGVWVREMPALYSLTGGEEPQRQLVNYRQHGVYLIADRLAEGWELKLGENIVQVRQAEGYAVQPCPDAPGCPTVGQATAQR
jgi:type IV secretory pathway VirB9-like protein